MISLRKLSENNGSLVFNQNYLGETHILEYSTWSGLHLQGLSEFFLLRGDF